MVVRFFPPIPQELLDLVKKCRHDQKAYYDYLKVNSKRRSDEEQTLLLKLAKQSEKELDQFLELYETERRVWSRMAGAVEYRVVDGDTLGSISARFGVKAAALQSANSAGFDWEQLKPGTIVLVPPKMN